MKLEKIIGWFLLILGIFLIFYPLYFSYQIFNGKSQTPEIFKTREQKEELLPQKGKTAISPAELQKEMEKVIEEKVREIFPAEFLPKLLNLISWSIFTGILIFGGSKISGLGIQLIRK